MAQVTTFLWFDDQAEEAMNFYVSLFPNSRIVTLERGQDGKVFVGSFELDGVTYQALNAGPMFKFTEAISLYVDCADQAEVDRLWAAFMGNGGSEPRCGWLKDKFGLSWQIVPRRFRALMSDPNPAKVQAVQAAMMQMEKLDVAELERAYAAA